MTSNTRPGPGRAEPAVDTRSPRSSRRRSVPTYWATISRQRADPRIRARLGNRPILDADISVAIARAAVVIAVAVSRVRSLGYASARWWGARFRWCGRRGFGRWRRGFGGGGFSAAAAVGWWERAPCGHSVGSRGRQDGGGRRNADGERGAGAGRGAGRREHLEAMAARREVMESQASRTEPPEAASSTYRNRCAPLVRR